MSQNVTNDQNSRHLIRTTILPVDSSQYLIHATFFECQPTLPSVSKCVLQGANTALNDNRVNSFATFNTRDICSFHSRATFNTRDI